MFKSVVNSAVALLTPSRRSKNPPPPSSEKDKKDEARKTGGLGHSSEQGPGSNRGIDWWSSDDEDNAFLSVQSKRPRLGGKGPAEVSATKKITPSCRGGQEKLQASSCCVNPCPGRNVELWSSEDEDWPTKDSLFAGKKNSAVALLTPSRQSKNPPPPSSEKDKKDGARKTGGLGHSSEQRPGSNRGIDWWSSDDEDDAFLPVQSKRPTLGGKGPAEVSATKKITPSCRGGQEKLQASSCCVNPCPGRNVELWSSEDEDWPTKDSLFAGKKNEDWVENEHETSAEESSAEVIESDASPDSTCPAQQHECTGRRAESKWKWSNDDKAWRVGDDGSDYDLDDKSEFGSPGHGYVEHRRFFAQSEDAAIIDGVRHYGAGNWISIKDAGGEALASRRPSQVKDRWRTLVKQGRTGEANST